MSRYNDYERQSEGRRMIAEEKAEQEYTQNGQEECEAQAREELGEDATEDEVDDRAREIFYANYDHYVDPCQCSAPDCPCTGNKSWGPL